MDLRRRLGIVLDRVQLSQRELELQPEAFQATEQLRLAAGDLATVLREIDLPIPQTTGSADAPGGSDAQEQEGSPGMGIDGTTRGQNPGTGLALARPLRLAA